MLLFIGERAASFSYSSGHGILISNVSLFIVDQYSQVERICHNTAKMKTQFSTPVLLLASVLPLCSAWGSLGHNTVAYVATNFGMSSYPLLGLFFDEMSVVTKQTKTYFQKLLNDTSADYLASVATWVELPGFRMRANH